MSDPNTTPQGPELVEAPRRYRAYAWVGLLVHVFLGFFPYAATGLMAPPYGVAIAFLGWGILLGVIIRFWRTRPKLIVWVPLIDVLYWAALITFGDVVLGWGA